MDHEHRPLPDGLEGSGCYVQGHNRSDDLFMFLKRRVDGLRPNTAYAVSVPIDLATNVPAGLIGIGGSPGESVFVKAGASTVEPLVEEDSNQYLRMNIDRGNQSRGGESMVVLGNVAHPDVANREYRCKTLDNIDLPLSVTTDSEGRVWLIVGTDSGFEGLSKLYYTRISHTLSLVEPPNTGDYTPPVWALALMAGIGTVPAGLGLVFLESKGGMRQMRSTLLEVIPRIALAAAIALAVAACGGDDEEKRTVETATAAAGTPAPQLNTPAPTANETVLGGIEAAARKLLADELEVDEGEFKLNSSEGMGWSDASLGCPKEGWAYAQVLTSGYKLIFDLAGTSYAVHTNSDGSHMVICGDGQ